MKKTWILGSMLASSFAFAQAPDAPKETTQHPAAQTAPKEIKEAKELKEKRKHKEKKGASFGTVSHQKKG